MLSMTLEELEQEQKRKEQINQLIENLPNGHFVIADKMVDKQTFKEFRKTIYSYLKLGFEDKPLRECPIHFKFQPEDEEENEMQLRHFYTNLLFWEPLIRLKSVKDLDESFIIDCSMISTGYIKSYIDNKLIIPYRDNVSNKKLNMIIHDMIFNLSKISTDFNIILGLTINVETFLNMSEENKRFDEIIRTRLDESMQPAEIEKLLDDLSKEQLDILLSTSNPLQPMLKAKSGIKTKQLSEISISGGLKPNLAGNTIPIPINGNLIVGGLNSVTNYYIDSTAGRKSMIMNNTVMGKSGHFSRKCMLLASNVNLRNDNQVCNTVRPLKIFIETKKHLMKFVGRYYRLPTGSKYQLLKETDTDLIGKYIYVKSPMTCASKHGVCRECYGEPLFQVNSGICVGSYAGAIITNPIGQSILSSKHILTTTSETIQFPPEFDKVFTLYANEILVNDESDELMDWNLLIIHDNIVFIDDVDEGEYNKFVTMFHLQNTTTGEIIEIQDKDAKEIYISADLQKELGIGKKKKKVYSCPISELPINTTLFIMEIENNELTRPLYNIMKLLDNNEKRAQLNVKTIDDLAQKTIELFIESNIDVQSVHGEVLLSQLIRRETDILKRPDFSKYKSCKDYQILTLNTALEKHPSPLIGLAFQFLKRQFSSPLTFKKCGDSSIDPFFRERP